MYNKFLMLILLFNSTVASAGISLEKEYKLLDKYNVKILIENIVEDTGEPICILKNKDFNEPYYISDFCANPKVVIINNEIIKVITIDNTGNHIYQSYFTIHNEKFTPIGTLSN